MPNAGFLDSVIGVSQGGIRIAKKPQSPRSETQHNNLRIVTKAHRQRAVLGRIVKCDPLVIVHSRPHGVPAKPQSLTHDAMRH